MKALALMVLAIAGPAWADYPSGRQQMRIEIGMTQDDVLRFLGAPDRVEQQTCGQNTRKPWSCRIWRFESADTPGRSFSVYFGRIDGAWLVNNWD